MNRDGDRPIDRLRRMLQDDRDRLAEATERDRARLAATAFDQALTLAALEAEIEDLTAALHHTDVARLEAEGRTP